MAVPDARSAGAYRAQIMTHAPFIVPRLIFHFPWLIGNIAIRVSNLPSDSFIH